MPTSQRKGAGRWGHQSSPDTIWIIIPNQAPLYDTSKPNTMKPDTTQGVGQLAKVFFLAQEQAWQVSILRLCSNWFVSSLSLLSVAELYHPDTRHSRNNTWPAGQVSVSRLCCNGLCLDLCYIMSVSVLIKFFSIFHRGWIILSTVHNYAVCSCLTTENRNGNSTIKDENELILN